MTLEHRAKVKASRRKGGAEAPPSLKYTDLENGAGEEIRTLDPNLGKVVLYP